MGIRERTALLVTATLVCTTVLVVLVFGALVLETFHRLETNDASQNVRLVTGWVKQQTDPQASNAQSYGAWTPTLRYVLGQNSRYPERYLKADDLESLNAGFMVFLDAKGNVVGSRGLEGAGGEGGEAPDGVTDWVTDNAAGLRFTDAYDKQAMVVAVPEGVAVMGAAPITNSASTGPIEGTLVVGRILDDEDYAGLRLATGLNDAKVYSLAGRDASGDAPGTASGAASSAASGGVPGDVAGVVEQLRRTRKPVVLVDDDTERVVGYELQAPTAQGDAPVVARVALERTINAKGQELLVYTIIGFVAFILVTLVALLVVLNTSVLDRLAKLSARVSAIGEAEMPNERVDVDGKDEIGELAANINGMLEAIDESRFELVQMATHDALTGVYNRRRFEEELARELAEFERLGKGGALLWFDLDHFKEINDEHGHGAGDEVLVWFAGRLRDETRKYSTLARLGGDEFVMVIPGADEAEATRAAMRLLDIFAETPCEVAGQSIHLSTSIGIAVYPRDGESVEDLLVSADTAMYRAKHDGRGRVRSFVSVDE